jgi:non-specific serine/threonine protein kinase
MLVKYGWLADLPWDALILDEAQAIKNPATKQAKAVKRIQAGCKIAMTGTPIENRLSDLWSLFDFLNQGLLGSAKEFTTFTKQLQGHPEGYGPLKRVVSPFILRRLKTDRAVIADLPDKIEMKSFAGLTKKQAALYADLVADVREKLESTGEGIGRRGLILASITKFKQICNHPDQYLGQQVFDPSESGKFGRLAEICETIYEKRERVLVFTQFKEITGPLQAFLETIFHHRGLILHGGTPVAKRHELVATFQGPDYVPFMVLSIKAGGVGLNLTKANHVIHFDRWWNPAVENQATDRAFRIGQEKNVVVHKFITRGTIEEKIDQLIQEKLQLSQDIVPDQQENWIGDMDNRQLLELFRLSV